MKNEALLNDLPATIRDLMFNPEVTDVVIQADSSAFFDRGRGMEPVQFEPFDWPGWMVRLLAEVGKSWDARFPFCDLSFECWRFHLVFPPTSGRFPALSIRKIANGEGFQALWKKDAGFHSIHHLVKNKKSILISGGTGTGKTTLLDELLSHVPKNHRIVAIEDTRELSPQHPHFLSLEGRPESADGVGAITLRSLFRQTLRMRPDRIVLGECRGEEVFEFLQSLNTGHQGSMATVHASSVRQSLDRMELLAILALGGKVDRGLIRDWLVSGLDAVIQLEHSPESGRVISRISLLDGIESGTILLRNIYIKGDSEFTVLNKNDA